MIEVEKLKQKILDLAIRGKLVPQDPNDESASVLIEKIKKEKEQLVKEGKIKASKNDSYIYKSSDNCYYEKEYVLGDILSYEQPGPFIVKTTNYSNSYDIPVLTPGKSFILGYTSEKEGIYHVDDKVIIFDDFTTDSRLIDFDFKVKSSAMKILSNTDKNKFNINYIFLLLKSIEIDTDTHKRYWISEYMPYSVNVPPLWYQNLVEDFINVIFYKIDEISNNQQDIERLVSKVKIQLLDNCFGDNSSYKSYYKNYIPFEEDVEIFDNLRKPINRETRLNRISKTDVLYPYYGSTGQTGLIDEYIFEGEYVLLGEDGAPFLDKSVAKAYIVNGKFWVNNHAHVLKSKTNNKFLKYYLDWIDYSNYVTGTTRLKLNQKMLKKIMIPNIPKSTKEKIVGIIEATINSLNKTSN